ncbi:AraC family transcriptional regulator [Elizabethkingia miricola]|uniref:AraC family transcriptional regulator n=1 Tax=Elizabethkingia miricola TaxID=172045 RepID=UPI0009C097F9|nr:AraC family transcriptional regulator [Elizabethkingia miricola]
MSSSADLYRNRINKVIDHINNNLDHTMSLEELSAVACFSPFHFHRIFKTVTGETVKNFTNRLRMEKAARLLRFSKNRLTDIASACGFSDATSLSRLFRQNFGITPRDYKKGIAIKNSKICQDLYPVNAYYCNADLEELEKKYPVEIRTIPKRRIAYIRVVDAFSEGIVIDAFRKLTEWSKKQKLFDRETIFGMSLDDPEVTPKSQYRYEVCITLPYDLKIDSDMMVQITVLPECKYAVSQISGDLREVGLAINYMFETWLVNSGYECEHLHAMEIFRDKDQVCNWEHFELDFCIPIKEFGR